MEKYRLLIAKYRRRMAGGSVQEALQRVAGKLQMEGVPFRRFLFPYVDTVSVTPEYDTAVYMGEWILLAGGEELDGPVERAMAWAAAEFGKSFVIEEHRLEETAQAADFLQGKSFLRRYRKERDPAMVLCEFRADVGSLLRRGLYDVKLRECAGACLAFEEICRRQIRLKGGRTFFCAALHFVFEIPADKAQEMLDKLKEEFQSKIVDAYGRVEICIQTKE